MVGLDGSRPSWPVITHLASWTGGGRALVVGVVEPHRLLSLGLMPTTVRAALESAARAELAAVREERAGLLALGARGTGGAARFLLGSVADDALSQPHVPVLIVK